MSGANSYDIENISNLLKNTDVLASEIASLWTSWKTGKNISEQLWNELVQYLYATSTRDTTNNQNPWGNSTHVPILSTTKDNLKANLLAAIAPNDEFFRFEGHDMTSESIEKRRYVENYLQTKHRLSKFKVTLGDLVDDWITYGNCFAMVTYISETHTDPDTKEITSGYIGPKVERISPYDIVFNPLATDFKHSPKIIRKLKTLGELARDAEENPELGYSKEVLEKIIKVRSVNDWGEFEDANKHLQLQFDGFGTAAQYFRSGFVEILEFYGDIYNKVDNKFYKNHVVTVVDRTWVFRNQELNTWTGRPHIYHAGWRSRPDNLWHMGPLDNLVGMQYRIDHLENARADAFDQMLDPDLIIVGDVDEQRVTDPNGNVGPSTRWYISTEGGQVTQLVPDTTVLNADFQIDRYIRLMELAAGAPREAMGVRSPGEKTKFEVQSLQNAASRMFQQKVNEFEEVFLEDILAAELEVSRRNLDTIDTIRVIDDDLGVVEFLNITKEDITSSGRLVPIGGRHFAKQAQMSQNLVQFQNVLNSDPLMKEHFSSIELGKLWADLMELDNTGVMQPYIRTSEQTELARLQQVAQQRLQEEDQTSIDDEDEGLI